jgi:putative phage-type endonuclease
MDTTLFIGAIDIVEYLDSIKQCPSYENAYLEWSGDLSIPNEIEASDVDVNTMEDYIDIVGNMFQTFIKSSSKNTPWSEKESSERKNHIETLINRPNVPQRTQEWYEQSRTVLTASEFSVILGTPRAVETLAHEKTLPPRIPSVNSNSATPTINMGPMDWGVRFEPVVKQILTQLWKANIIDIGRLIHENDKRIAASPDGLIQSAEDETRIGRLLEIKCPIRRVINESVPFEYWCQMQIQMEVADIDECEYVEMKIASPYKSNIDSYIAPDDIPEYYGKVWIVQDVDTCALKYAYTEDELHDFEGSGHVVIETIPWHLERMFNRVISRDRAWFSNTSEKRAEFWTLVESIRSGSIVPSPKRTKIPKEVLTVYKMNDD